MVQVAIDVEVCNVMMLAVVIVLFYEGGQGLIEEALDQLNIVTHLWENTT